jgi:hypothetical protein
MIEDLFRDPIWRLTHLYPIVDKQGNKVFLKPNPVQQRLNESKAKRKLILKARQQGVSTNEILKTFDDAIWNRHRTNVILAHEQDAITKLFRIVSRAYNFMDEDLRPEPDRGGGSKYELFFPDINSRIYCDLESRGDTIHRLHVSEAAFFKDPSRLIATLQAVPIHSPVTIESTPNGMNFFYDLWMDQGSGYEKLFFPWFLFPEYTIQTRPLTLSFEEKALIKMAKKKYGVELTHGQIAFRRAKQAELKRLFIQEYPEDDQSCFLSSGDAACDLVVVKALFDAAPSPVEETDTVKIYEPRDKSKFYVIGADTAEGSDGDYSVATVYEVGSRRQVAVLRGHLKPFEFAHQIAELAELYKSAQNVSPTVAVERNNHGHAVLLELHEHIHYPALYRHSDEKLGWLTDRVTRPLMLDTFIDGLENRSITVVDRTTLQECLTLIKADGKIEAGQGKHDDTVMASAIAVQMCIKEGSSSFYQDVGSYIRI